jgi:phosphohistidine phosphatase
MARQIWLLRHTDAEPHGVRPDSERRLTDRGERQARIAGQALVRMDVRFDSILVSPKERAQRTAALAAESLTAQQQGLVETHRPLASGFDGVQAFDALAGMPADGRLLLVGHEPDLSGVVADLTGAMIDLKKGGLAVVRLQSVGGELVVLMRPHELALIADLPDADV